MKTPSHYARSIRCAGLVTMIAAASAVQACSSDSIPTEPSSLSELPSVARPFAPEPTQLRVSGTVTDDEGVPVAGVKVTVYGWTAGGQPRSAVTDRAGFYNVSFVPVTGISAFTEKEGYESTWHTHSTSGVADFQFDLRIKRIRK